MLIKPDLKVDKTGAWPGNMPMSPSSPGIVTIHTFEENKR
jgi:hypothetical protein